MRKLTIWAILAVFFGIQAEATNDAAARAQARAEAAKQRAEERQQAAAARALERAEAAKQRAQDRQQAAVARAVERQMFSGYGTSGFGGGSQAGSVEIAKAVPPTDVLTAGAVDCLKESKQVLTADKAAEFCLKVMKAETDRAKRIANEAADATKASRPIILSRRYRGGYW